MSSISTIKQLFTLTRNTETGRSTQTTMMFLPGMPDTLVIEQRLPDGLINKVELTVQEAKVFRYILGEVEHIHNMVENMDKGPRDEW